MMRKKQYRSPSGAKAPHGTMFCRGFAALPVAEFSAEPPLTGAAPFRIVIVDSSLNSPTAWYWEKNNGSGWIAFEEPDQATAQNPDEIFAEGVWSIRLTATNAAGSDTETKPDWIEATA